MGESKGGTLQEILESRAPLPPEQAIPMVIELANVLEVRHKQGKILGGIYPDQVLFEDGLVQLYELAAPRLPEDLTLMYLGFVPPEVLENQPLVAQSDIYSVGVILYSLLTGHFPFAGGNTEELIENIRQSKCEEFPKFSNFTQLEWIIKRCLVKVPARRFGTAQELALELRKMFKPSRSGQPVPVAAPVPGMTARKLQRRTREYQRLLLEHWKIAAGAAALLVAVLIVIAMWPENRELPHGTKNWRVERLTTTPDVERDASMSPDGRTIAFVSNATGNWELYVREGSRNPTQVTESPGKESDPRWSPDGQVILFTYEGPGIQPTLFSVPPTGGIPQKMVSNAVDGQWSPDGKKVCYVTPSQPGVRNLEILEVQALQSKPVVGDIQGLAHPSFSADSKEIVCEADSDRGHRLFVVEVKNGNMKPVGDVEGFTPSWDWQSGWIYYAARKDGLMKIWRTDPKGSTQTVTTGGGQDFHPAPSPAGGSVLFYRQDLLRDIFSIQPDSPQGVQVSPAPGESSYPRAVSAGTLAFVRVHEGHARLETSSLSSKTSSVVLDPISPQSSLSISPDGAFVHVENPQEGKTGLWEIALAGGQQMGLGAQLLLPYEPSPDKKLLFYASRNGTTIQYLLKEFKTQTEQQILTLPAGQRVRRAAWVDHNSIAYLTTGNTLLVYSIKNGTSSTLLDNCYDFALRPRADQAAAIVGSQPQRNSLVLLDLKTLRRRNLTSFDPEAYATTIDWSRDGKMIFYDRMKTSSDLFSAQ